MAEIIGVGSNPNAKEVFIDKGTDDGVQSGMGVITPDGIAGKVQAAYAASALVLLVNDASAGAGVLLENSRVRGVLKGSGSRQCRVDYVGNEVEVQVGEKVYTSGDDRIYPRGLPVGEVTGIGVGSAFQEIYVKPFAALDRLDEVLVIIAGVHQDLPFAPAAQPPQYLMPVPPPEEEGMSRSAPNTPPQPGDSPFPEARSSLANGLPPKPIAKTDADRLLERYRQIGAYQGHSYGEGNVESAPPNFKLGERRPPGGGPASQGRMENYVPPVPIVQEPLTEAVPAAPEQP
jgi:rod shape-determining protein MreC